MREIYLDNAATTPMSPKVINVITDEMKNDLVMHQVLMNWDVRPET